MLNQLEKRKRRSADCLSDFALDQFTTEALPHAADRQRIADHLAGCETCRTRLKEIEAVVAPDLNFGGLAAVASTDPAAPAAPAAPAPRPNHRRRWRFHAAWLAPLAAAAVVLFVPWRKSDVRSKGGGWQLGVVAQYPNGRVSGISPGAPLSPGDQLRFEVRAPSAAYVSVISLDATGAVTPFVPATGTAIAVPAGDRRLLDGAVRLDASLGSERLMLIACPYPVPVAEVVEAGRTALRQTGGRIAEIPGLALDCAQTSFWIRKEVRP